MVLTAVKRKLILILIVLWSFPLDPSTRSILVIWNIGQGQWITWASSKKCVHFDMGGDKKYFYAVLPKVLRLCLNKPNELALSHTDTDHINLISLYKRFAKKLCLTKKVLTTKPTHKKLINSLEVCHQPSIKPLYSIPPSDVPSLSAETALNDLSDIYQLAHTLMPGDGTNKYELLWLPYLSNHQPVHYLIAGHHGSRSSNGHKLLNALPQLKMVITSSRKSKYGHPHSSVKDRFRKYKIPLVTTEAWGSIYLYEF